MRKITLLICLVITVTGNAQTLHSSYNWILGKWEMKIENKSIFEEWNYENDSTYTGTSFMVNSKNEQRILENMELRTRKGITSYVPTVNGQNKNQPVEFEIKNLEKEKFTAENLNHDFPQRIVYELKNTTELYARIEGTKNGKARKEEWIFKK